MLISMKKVPGVGDEPKIAADKAAIHSEKHHGGRGARHFGEQLRLNNLPNDA